MTADDVSNHSMRWFNAPAVVTIIIAVVGQMFASVWWAASESARITATEEALKRLENNVVSLNTPLSVRVITLEKRVEDGIRDNTEQNKRIEAMDQQGTRALALISSNQQRGLAQLDRIAERVLLQDKRLGDIEGQMLYKIQSQIDGVTENIKRVEEAARQIKSIVDAQSSAMNEYFRRQRERDGDGKGPASGMRLQSTDGEGPP